MQHKTDWVKLDSGTCTSNFLETQSYEVGVWAEQLK
jgi:hypothetical protein